MTLGLIGAGHIGSQLARLAVAHGHDVVLSNSRGPDTLQDLVAELGTHACAGTPEEAARAGDIVVVTIPLKAIGTVPVAPLAGKIVIDTNNYYPQRDGRIAELDDESTTTAETPDMSSCDKTTSGASLTDTPMMNLGAWEAFPIRAVRSPMSALASSGRIVWTFPSFRRSE